MRISILGSNGQLGRDLTSALTGHEIRALTRKDFDVTEHARARAVLTEARPDLIVNLTAYHRVDDCESLPELAYGANTLAVLNLVRIANDLDVVLAHVSTDYVFDGSSASLDGCALPGLHSLRSSLDGCALPGLHSLRSSPYTESDEPRPLSVYANSKLAGEYLVRSTARKHFVIRTCGLYGRAGSQGKGGNFVETMLKKARNGDKIQVVNDQTLTPTSTADLARQMAVLLPTSHYGLFHMTNEGACSWYEFAGTIFDLAGLTVDLKPTTSELYKSPALRPRYSVLENKRLKDLGLNQMLHWREALAEYLNPR
jgi:dTDP-4-dehydrorhamnose reductase